MAGTAGPLARLVRERRQALGLSQTQVEARAGLAPRTVSNVETGRSTLPVPEHRRRLATVLRVTLAELLVAAGELTADELVEGSRVYHRSEDGVRLPRWLEDVSDELRDESETSPRARLVQEVPRMTQGEAHHLAEAFKTLPPSEATRRRRELPWPEYRLWRDRHDMEEKL